jgi:hypothetical protein
MTEFTAVTATIPTSTIDKLEEKIRKVNKKGGTFQFRVTDTTTIDRHYDYEGIPRITKVHASVVEVVGQQKNVDGANWHFIAHLDHYTSPAMVTTAQDDKGQTVAQYRDHSQHCDHCEQNRNRRYTYIAENVETGDRVQVGSTCLQAYFGDITAANLIVMATWLRTIPEWFEDGFEGNSSRPYYDTLFTLKGAAQSVINRGYHKTFGDEVPTRDDVPFITEFSPEAIELAEKAMEWIKSLDTSNDYLLNCQASVGAEWIDYRRHGGILCSIITAYQRHIAQQKVDEQRTKNRTADCPNDTSRHTVTGTVESIKEVSDYYGLTNKLLAEIDGGYKLYGTCPSTIVNANPGDRIQFDCRINFKNAGYGYISRPTKANII